MPGLSDGVNLTIALIFILGVGYLIYQIDRRVKSEGALVKQDGSAKSRLYALIIGLLIGSFVTLEWTLGFRPYLLMIVSLAVIGYGLGFDHLLEAFQPKKSRWDVSEIPGIGWMTADEVRMHVQAGGKFVVFEYCLSLYVRTVKRSSKIYFIKSRESYFDKIIGYSAISLIFGWLSPIKLYQTLRTNIGGGREVTGEVLALYDNPSLVLRIE